MLVGVVIVGFFLRDNLFLILCDSQFGYLCSCGLIVKFSV